MRPYITVSQIPNFDPTRLPYWDIYEREGTASKIMAGGTMAGQFTAGLSGGQRKMLLFEIIVQRTAHQSELLIVLDEPFAGVTDDCKHLQAKCSSSLWVYGSLLCGLTSPFSVLQSFPSLLNDFIR